jgi:hypothetical protein
MGPGSGAWGKMRSGRKCDGWTIVSCPITSISSSGSRRRWGSVALNAMADHDPYPAGHAHRHSAGTGHRHQGRFKSFPVQDGAHFSTLRRDVERNALRAGRVPRAEQWRWGSLGRLNGAAGAPMAPPLTAWPADWIERVNTRMSQPEEERL